MNKQITKKQAISIIKKWLKENRLNYDCYKKRNYELFAEINKE